MAELKPKSFRIEDETAEQFKAISQELGGNQQQTLSKLLECYEFQKGKTILTDKKGEIETFENYVTLITSMYMGSLHDNQNMKESVRAEFESLLKSKDSLIIELQNKLNESKKTEDTSRQELMAAITKLEDYKNDVSTYQSTIQNEREKFESTLKDKDDLNKALADSGIALKKEIESIKDSREELKTLKMKYESLQNDYAELKAKHDTDLLDQERLHSKEVKELTERYISLLKSTNGTELENVQPKESNEEFIIKHLPTKKKRASWDCYFELSDKIQRLCDQYKYTKNDVINTLLIEGINKYLDSKSE